MEKHPKVVFYCRVGTEEQLENSSTKHIPIIDEETWEKAQQVLQKTFRNRYMNISDYRPYKGFLDLREYDMSNKDFSMLWKVQDFLYMSNRDKDHLKKVDPILWNKIKELSGAYQQQLFSYPLKSNIKNNDDMDIEMER